LCDVATAKERRSFQIAGPGDPYPLPSFSIALTPDGKTLIAAYQWNTYDSTAPGSAVKVWDVASGKERAVFREAAFDVKSVASWGDGKALALAGMIPETNPVPGTDPMWAIKLWEVATGKDRVIIKHSTTVSGIVFSADGKFLASPNGPVLWNMPEGKQRDPLPWTGAGFTCVAFTPDGKTLVAGGQEACGIVRLWDVATGQELATLKAHQGKDSVTALAITADGKTLASAIGNYRPLPGYQVEGWGEVKLWDLPSGRAWATIKGLKAPPSSLAFTPDGKILATVGHRGDLKLWDMSVSE
jgi:WD40 repeat protein